MPQSSKSKPSWSALPFHFYENRENRREACEWLVAAFQRYSPEPWDKIVDNPSPLYNKIFITDHPRRSQTLNVVTTAHRVHFYLFNYHNWAHENVTPVIYSLLTGKKSSPNIAKEGMLIPFCGLNADTEGVLGSEISAILGTEVIVTWIKPSKEVLDAL